MFINNNSYRIKKIYFNEYLDFSSNFMPSSLAPSPSLYGLRPTETNTLSAVREEVFPS